MKDEARRCWLLLCKRLQARGDVEGEFEEIWERYAEPHRFYHNFPHINKCLSVLSSLGLDFHFIDSIEFALWIHDIVFNLSRNDNEERSADYAIALGSRLLICPKIIELSAEGIVATKSGNGLIIGGSSVCEYVYDIDRSILGAPWGEFKLYCDRVEKEYLQVCSLEMFRQGRKAFLQGLIQGDKRRLFYTDVLSARLELQAEANIHKALQLVA